MTHSSCVSIKESRLALYVSVENGKLVLHGWRLFHVYPIHEGGSGVYRIRAALILNSLFDICIYDETYYYINTQAAAAARWFSQNYTIVYS